MNRNIKIKSDALMRCSDPLAGFEAHRPNRGEGHDLLFVHGDEYWICEMQDGAFWAAPNHAPDDGRTSGQRRDDILDQVDFVPGKDDEGDFVRVTLPPAQPDYRGAYHATLAEALKAVHAWKLGAAIPRCYHPPLPIGRDA